MMEAWYGEIRAAGWSLRSARVWQRDKLDRAAVRVITAAVGLYLVGEVRSDVRRVVSESIGYALGYGAVLRRLS